jgi:urease accessory protein
MRLWQLISPTLPIGAYAYSQGQEYAVEAGWVHDEASAIDWIMGQLSHNLAYLDVPVFLRLYQAWQDDDLGQVGEWNQRLLAMRESAELRTEDQHLAAALQKVLAGLDVDMPKIDSTALAFATVFAFACQHWQIDRYEAAQGLLWSWCENQVAAAIKLIPLGQTAGQRMMSRAMPVIAQSVQQAQGLDDEDIGMSAPGLGIASARHETQYTRLFRS